MTCYLERTALNPMGSDVITPEALDDVLKAKLFNAPPQGSGWPPMDRRPDPVEDYNGTYVAPYLKLVLGTEPDRTVVYLCAIDGTVDFRVYDRDANDLLREKDTWTRADLEATYPALPAELLPMTEAAFQEVVRFRAAYSSPLSEEAVLDFVPAHVGTAPEALEVLLRGLSSLRPIPKATANLLRETYADARQAVARRGPHGSAGPAEMRRFGWHPVVYEALQETGHLNFLDWKGEAEEVGQVLAELAGRPVDTSALPSDEWDTYQLLEAAIPTLERMGLRLAWLGDHGDSYCIAVLPAKSAEGIADAFRATVDPVDLVPMSEPPAPLPVTQGIWTKILGRLFRGG